MFQRHFSIIMLVLSLSGCTILHEEIKNPAGGLIPDAYSSYTKQFSADAPWWLDFESNELDRLIQNGLKNNQSLAQTQARLAQAKAIAKKTAADLYPQLDGSGGFAHNRSGKRNGEEIANDDFSLGVAVSYEADIWGRINARTKEASMETMARQEDVYAAAFTLTSRIASTWLELISSRRRIASLRRQLGLNNRLLELVELRFTTAKASALDVYQQRQTIKAIEGALITLDADEQTSLNQLALLTGQAPGAQLDAVQDQFPDISPVPPGGFPADLLGARPDILAAEHRLQAASWSIAAARADRLPQVRLSGGFSYNSDILESLLDTWLLRLAADLSGPIFDGGRKKAEVEQSRAVADELLAGYRQTVLNAILEVEDSLVLEQRYRKNEQNIKEQISLTEMAYREATWRYLNGLSDYLPVLREQINLITLQQDLILAQKNILDTRVTLHKALGGSWPRGLVHGTAQSPPRADNDRKPVDVNLPKP